MTEENESVEEIPEWKIKQLNRMPIIESKIGKSKDGRFVIHKVVITDIKPVEYYEKVMG